MPVSSMLAGMRALILIMAAVVSISALPGCGKRSDDSAAKKQPPGDDAAVVRPADAGVPPADAVPATPPGTPDIEVPAPVLE